MTQKKRIKHLLFLLASSILIVIAWVTLSGAIQQWPRATTLLKQIETCIQFLCCPLSVGVVLSAFLFRKIAKYVRIIWAICFVGTAVMSSLVWGPPMVLPALVFGTASMSIALGISYVFTQFEPR